MGCRGGQKRTQILSAAVCSDVCSIGGSWVLISYNAALGLSACYLNKDTVLTPFWNDTSQLACQVDIASSRVYLQPWYLALKSQVIAWPCFLSWYWCLMLRIFPFLVTQIMFSTMCHSIVSKIWFVSNHVIGKTVFSRIFKTSYF